MFHDQSLMDRRMACRIDKAKGDEPPRNMNRLPDGLRNVGMGLGQACIFFIHFMSSYFIIMRIENLISISNFIFMPLLSKISK